MLHMEPVLKRGYVAWERHLLPLDEYQERIRSIQSMLVEDGLGALVVWGGPQDAASLSYVSGSGVGPVVVPARGQVTSLGGTGRDGPFQRTLTWISDFAPGGGAGPQGDRIRKVLEDKGIAGGPIGTVAAPTAPGLAQELAPFELRPFDARLAALRVSKRVREVATVSRALAIATEAADAARRAWEAGGTNAQAFVAAERSARGGKARDFRALANVGADELRPYEGLTTDRRGQLTLWLAVEYAGYWADVSLTAPASASAPADAAVAAMVAAARGGTAAGAVAKAAVAVLPRAAVDRTLAHGLGQGIGLALREPPTIEPASEEKLVEGMLLSLRAYVPDGARSSIASAIVQVGATASTRIGPA